VQVRVEMDLNSNAFFFLSSDVQKYKYKIEKMIESADMLEKEKKQNKK